MTLSPGPDGRLRCSWCLADAGYIAYHDAEWGLPVTGERDLFEMLTLESFQSGLSWHTILRKRDGFRRAFADFDTAKIAGFGGEEVERLVTDAAIVRHRGKIEAAIHNARQAEALYREGGTLAELLWRFAPAAGGPGNGPGPSPEATALSKELRRRGWKFVGPTTVHAFMQAAGMVNDHDPGCAFHGATERAQAAHRADGN